MIRLLFERRHRTSHVEMIYLFSLAKWMNKPCWRSVLHKDVFFFFFSCLYRSKSKLSVTCEWENQSPNFRKSEMSELLPELRGMTKWSSRPIPSHPIPFHFPFSIPSHPVSWAVISRPAIPSRFPLLCEDHYSSSKNTVDKGSRDVTLSCSIQIIYSTGLCITFC